MKKHTYRSKNVNKINFSQVKERLENELAVFAIDIAKEKQYGLLSNASGTVSEFIWWNHPEQTVELLSAHIPEQTCHLFHAKAATHSI